ncbi:MAG: hypothetical protein HFE63_02425 [Clostridiales bacterium]|nr:hypothetical protein [Clostridiales bacterium]
MNKVKKESRQVRRMRPAKEMLAESLIISFLMRLASAIYRKLGDGIIGGAFTAYDRENEALQSSATATCVKQLDLGGKVIYPIKHKIAKSFENSFILNKIRTLLANMLSCQIKVYGLFLFSFALYSAIVFIFKTFFFSAKGDALDVGTIVTLVLMVIASVGMISSRYTLAESLLGSSVSCFFLFEVVGLRREAFENTNGFEGKFNFAFIAGLVFGIASYFVSPLMLLIGIVGVIAAYLVLISPEFGVLAIIVLLPIAPTMGLVAAVLYTSVCYFLKLICGKRSLNFDLLDGTVFIFMILMIGGGLVALSRDSFKPMLVYVAFMLGYFLVVNLIRSRKWMTRCIIGAIFSCTMVSLYGLYQNFFGQVERTWQDSDMFSEIEGRVVSTFENPNVLAEYLIMVLPLMLAVFIIKKTPMTRFLMFMSMAVTGGCLIYTWSRGAWLGFLIGILLFMLIYSKNTLTVMLFGVLGVPFLPFILPDSITQRFLSIGNLGDSSTSYRVYIWKGVTNMLGDYFTTGIGIGNDSFRLVYPRYALSGIETAPHSHNLYLQILVEIGIVGLIVFIAAMFFYVQSCFTLQANESRSSKLLSAAIMCGILAVLAQGMTDYIWYNYRVFLMFWLVLGLGAAVRKVHVYTAEEASY